MPIARCAAFSVAAALALGAVARAAPPAATSQPALDLPLEGQLDTAALDSTPGNDDLAREYPPLANLLQLGGSATMTCKVLASGRLDQCQIVSETPAGMGFGAATLRTAPFFHAHATAPDAQIIIPMRWQSSVSDASPTLSPPAPEPLASPASLDLARRIMQDEDFAGRAQKRWRSYIDQYATRVSDAEDIKNGQAVLDALRQGASEVASAEADHVAHVLASQMDRAQLAETATFLESPAGHAYLKAGIDAAETPPADAMKRLTDAARTHLCGSPVCSYARPQPVATAAP